VIESEILERLAELLGGGRVTRLRALPGGLAARMDAFDLVQPAGPTRQLVLRRYKHTTIETKSKIPAHCWAVLSALQNSTVPAPEPVWFDPAGALFDEPAIVMARLPGSSRLPKGVDATWIAGFAGALANLHRTVLPKQTAASIGEKDLAAEMLQAAPARVETHRLGGALLEALRRWAARRPRGRPALVHGDYWAGNTLWLRGRLTGIVDWDECALGDPGWDVGYCRMDLAMMLGDRAPDLFLNEYQRIMGPCADLAAWDLLAAVRALPDPARWLPGYHDLGRTDVTADDMSSRLDGFIELALGRLTGNSNSLSQNWERVG
jgi:aminoglycoside phosphotransferase (APT) family kinase protein